MSRYPSPRRRPLSSISPREMDRLREAHDIAEIDRHLAEQELGDAQRDARERFVEALEVDDPQAGKRASDA